MVGSSQPNVLYRCSAGCKLVGEKWIGCAFIFWIWYRITPITTFNASILSVGIDPEHGWERSVASRSYLNNFAKSATFNAFMKIEKSLTLTSTLNGSWQFVNWTVNQRYKLTIPSGRRVFSNISVLEYLRITNIYRIKFCYLHCLCDCLEDQSYEHLKHV